jgi:hypothetical protein
VETLKELRGRFKADHMSPRLRMLRSWLDKTQEACDALPGELLWDHEKASETYQVANIADNALCALMEHLREEIAKLQGEVKDG